MPPEARSLSADDLRVGLRAEFERDITAEDVLEFARNTGDHNPLHVDGDYAATTNFQRRIVHGAYQVGLASAMIGMHLPGRRVLLGSMNARFGAPLYFPARVVVHGEIAAWNHEQQSGQLKVVVMEASRRVPTAEVVMGFTLHEPAGGAALPAPSAECAASAAERPVTAAGRKAVLVTGASGGIGTAAVGELAADYTVLALVNRQSLSESLKNLPNVYEVQADLADPSVSDAISAALGAQPLYAVVHAAWPGAPRGGLLDAADGVIDRQLAFGGPHLVRLARLLYSKVTVDGGRFIALGSIAGSYQPTITLAAYSLGKNTLEMTVRLLAPELARKQITINAICPGFVPVGINQQANSRQQKLEIARIPLGRLCEPADVIQAARFLLSPAASFVSGQILGLTGGQL